MKYSCIISYYCHLLSEGFMPVKLSLFKICRIECRYKKGQLLIVFYRSYTSKLFQNMFSFEIQIKSKSENRKLGYFENEIPLKPMLGAYTALRKHAYSNI